jgi:hypothetical protein
MHSFRDCAVAGLAALLTVGLLEVGMRAVGAKYEASLYQADEVLYFTFRPNAEGWTAEEGENYVQINSLGMRDRERAPVAPTDTIGIAFLGDSMLAAIQVPLDQTMTQRLERRLSQAAEKTGRKIEVLNFGVGGYALSQMYLSLDERVWAFRPSIVAVCVSQLTVPNSYRKTKSFDNIPLFDLEGGRLILDPDNRPPSGTSEQSKHWHQVFGDFYNRFRILQLARAAQQSQLQKAFGWSHASPATDTARGADEFMRTWPYSEPRTPELTKAWQITEATLTRMIDVTRAHGAEFWLVQIGNEIEEDPRDAERQKFLERNHLEDLGYASRRYAAFAAQHGVYYLYLAPAMREYSENTGIPLRGFFNTRPYEGHWNEAGNATAAEIISTEFLKRSRVFAESGAEANAK